MTKKKHLTDHDRFAKVSLQDRHIAEDFFKAHVPEEIQELIDWTTLELQSGTFIDEDYHANYTDILYRVDMDKQPGYLFVLAEHQSRADPLMPFRILNYLCKIWDRHLKQLKQDKKDGTVDQAEKPKLPLILPLTVYHGKVKPYPHSMYFFDLFQNKDVAREILLANPFPLVDLTVTPDDEITQHGHAAVMELIQKYIFQRDILPAFKQLASEGLLSVAYKLDDGQYLIKVIEYAISKGEAVSPEALLDTLATALPNEEDKLMTIAEQLRQQGKQQGMQQGMQQGIEQEKVQIAKNMLTKGADEQFVTETTGLSKDVLAKLKKELNIG